MADRPDIPATEETVDGPTATDVTEDIDAAEPEEAEKLHTEDGDGDESPAAGRLARWHERLQRRRLSRVATALVAGAVVVATLAGLSGWLGCRAYQKHEVQGRQNLYVATARQGAVNLTTINYTQVDADVQRILDVATGAFRDDFEQRAKPFEEVVKAAQSKSEGTVTDAGLESQRGDSAQVLVAVAVKSRTAGGEEAPREWRMRIEVRSVGDDAKVSNVVFVP